MADTTIAVFFLYFFPFSARCELHLIARHVDTLSRTPGTPVRLGRAVLPAVGSVRRRRHGRLLLPRPRLSLGWNGKEHWESKTKKSVLLKVTKYGIGAYQQRKLGLFYVAYSI